MGNNVLSVVVIDVIDETGCFIRDEGIDTGACKRYTHEEIHKLVKKGISLFSNRGDVDIASESRGYIVDGKNIITPCVDLTRGNNRSNLNGITVLTLGEINKILEKNNKKAQQ